MTTAPAIHFQVALDATPLLRRLEDGLLRRLADPRAAVAAGVRAVRASVAREFAERAWYAPDGSVRTWPALAPFGRTVASRPPLVGAGAYPAAWAGGAGSLLRQTPTGAAVGVSGARFPYAAALRGGAGTAPTLGNAVIKPHKLTAGRRNWRGPQRWAMWWRLFLDYGVTLAEATMERGLLLPARPHATANPRLVEGLRRIFRSYVVEDRVAA